MKKIVYCVFILIICSTLVLAEQTLMSYSISEGGSVGGMSKFR